MAAQVDESVVEQLWALLEAQPGAEITVDLESRTVRAGEGDARIEAPFEIDDYTRWRLLEGLDDIAITLSNEESITEFEKKRPEFKPSVL